jgi:Ricin-type beta-trefoil lectin domain
MTRNPATHRRNFLVVLFLAFAGPAPRGAMAQVVNVPTSIVAKHSAKCLDVADESLADGGAVIQYTCKSSDNQLWTLRPYQDAYQVVVKHSGKCLNVNGATQNDGEKVIQWPCVGAANELWYARPNGASFQLVAKHSGKCLNVYASRSRRDHPMALRGREQRALEHRGGRNLYRGRPVEQRHRAPHRSRRRR